MNLEAVRNTEQRIMGRSSAFFAMGTLLALVVGGSAGCGGSSAASGGASTTPANAAKDSAGNVIKSSSGAAVSKEAEANWKEAVAAFDAAEKSGWNESTCDSVGKVFARANREQGGKFAEATYMSGLVLDRCGKRDEALKYFNDALAMDSKLCGARVGVGVSEFRQGHEAQAFSTFEKAVRDDARCTEGYTNLAMMQMARSGPGNEDALNNLRRALAINASYLPAFNQMALLYLGRAQGNAKMLDLAAVVCRQAQLINANYAPIYNTWGLINMRKQNVFDALRMFERASQLDPSIFEAHMNFGEITLGFRGYEDARKAFSKAVELRPKSYDAHVGLGAALRGLNDAEGAKKQYEEARGLDASRPEAYFNLGILYQDYMSGSVPDMKQALSYYQEFVSRARGNTAYKPTVDEIERRCESSEAKKKRKSSKSCRPGRKQNIELAIEAMAAMAEMEKMQQQGGGATPPPPPAK
jgi:tetratricopeptide (TPR) repeat protein